MRKSSSGLSLHAYFLAGANQPDHVDVRDHQQPVFEHPFDHFGSGTNLLGSVDHRQHDRQVPRDVQKALLVLVALGAVSQDAAIHRGARDVHHAKFFHDGIVERLVVPFVGLAQKISAASSRAQPFADAGASAPARDRARVSLMTVVSCTSISPSVTIS